jgi:hypothetical protein
MNSFDTNFDGGNEVYAANTKAFAYGVGETDGEGNWKPGETQHPVRVDGQKPVRVYLTNVTEFDLVNSFHTHSQFFDKCLKSYIRPMSNRETTTEATQTRTTAAATEVAA